MTTTFPTFSIADFLREPNSISSSIPGSHLVLAAATATAATRNTLLAAHPTTLTNASSSLTSSIPADIPTISTTSAATTTTTTTTIPTIPSTTTTTNTLFLDAVNIINNTTSSLTSSLSPCDNPNLNWTEPQKIIWQPHVIQRVATIVVVMLLALIGNTAIILLLTCTRYRKRNSRVNIFIIHLAIGDLTVCFCTMTTEILFVAFDQWVLGAALCKILPYLQLITLASTTFILTAMSFDRYLAICKPLKYRATTTRAKRFIAVSWILAFVLCVPQLFIFVQTEDTRHCRTYYQCKSKGYTALWQRMLYFSFCTVYILIIPVILISFFYTSIVLVVSRVSQEIENDINATTSSNLSLRRPSTISGKSTFPRAKIKTLKMTFAIIATFVICWTPYFVTTLVRIYSNYKIHIPDSVMAFVETIAFVQSLLNPILYGFFNVKVKRSLRDLLCIAKDKGMRRSPTYNNYRTPGGLGLMSVSSGGLRNRSRPIYEMKICGKSQKSHLQESMLNNVPSASSSGNSQERSLSRSSAVLTEENKNGVRLRVRFPAREPYKHVSTEGLDYKYCNPDFLCPYDIFGLPSSGGHGPRLYRPHSHQHLYSPIK